MKVLNDSGSGCFDIRGKIRTISEQWRMKTPKEKFLMLYGIPRKMFEIVGVRVYGDCQLNLFSHFGNLLVVYYLSMVSYTIYYWTCKGQFVYGLRCLCGMGIMISVNYCLFPVSVQLLLIHFTISFFNKFFLDLKALPLYYKSIGGARFKYRSILNFAGDYMYEDKKNSASRFSMVCEGGAQKMLKSYIIMTCIICTSMNIVTMGPTLLFLRTGVWITPLGTQFPYADQSDFAFYLDLVIQMAVGFLGIMITVSIEMSQVIVNNAIIMGSDVTTLSANELTEQLSSDGGVNVVAQAKFHNLVLQIQDFDRYVVIPN